jgi:DNA (cytosine-5)-methyltransferase 1
MKFIDLFAGLGGFHIALSELGHECVFASELKSHLRELYQENFNIKPFGNIKSVDIKKDIPNHDILCAGFPCQPFSKAGNREGLDDKKNGNLFTYIANILKEKKPNFFILENVKSLLNHDEGRTYKYIEDKLTGIGYSIDKEIYSPHNIGIPQHRERIFIVGSRTGLKNFKWPKKEQNITNINDILNDNKSSNSIEKLKIDVINLWQEFLDSIDGHELPAAPIWSMEYGATYPFEKTTPYYSNTLDNHKGSFGVSLKNMNKYEQLLNIPKYARRENLIFPDWKIKYIKNNRRFYLKHEKKLKPIVKKISKLKSESFQKLEWNIKEIKKNRDIRNHLIQFRGSGVRVKKTNFFPSLVTVGVQVPIIGKDLRYLTKIEGAKLQSMEGIKLPKETSLCFSALGNAVNANVVKVIAKSLLENA